MPNGQNEPAKNRTSIEEASMLDLRWASEELKARIAEAKARNDVLFDSTLGNPNWDKNAADGHLDVRGDDDDGWPHLPVKTNKTSPP
jgi:hypothetical protein